MDFDQAGVSLKSLLPGRLCLAAAVILVTTASGLTAQGQDLPTVVSNLKVEPSPFSPNGDGENEFTKFSFFLSEASSVSVDIIFYTQTPNIGGHDYFIAVSQEELTIGGETVIIYPSTIYTSSNVSGLVEFSWNGKLTEGFSGLLPDTVYTFLIRVEDLDTDDNLKTLPVTGTVIIDKQPPAIYDISATPNPFSPNDDHINDIATISFKLSGIPQMEEVGYIGFYLTAPDPDGNRTFALDPASTSPDIYNPNVATVVETGPVPLEFIKRSNNSADFTFQLSGGRILDSGDTVSILTSPVTILAADPLGKVYRDQQQQKFSYVKAVMGYSGSNTVDESNIVQVRTSAVSLKVDIRNSYNQQVATLDPQFEGGREYSVILGPQLDDDTYTYIITAADQAGNQSEVSGSVTARSNPINITDLVIDPDTISPVDDNALYDFTNISFRLTRTGRANLQIFRDSTFFVSNNLVRTLMSDTLLEAGGQTLRWDGRNQQGQYVFPGGEKAFRVIISAFDPDDFEQTEARGLIYVDNRLPAEILLNRQPSPTKVAVINVTGITEPNVRVQPYVNGTTLDSLRSGPVSGLFAFQPPVSEGLNLINALAYDRVENGPTYSDTLRLVLDTQPPLMVDTLIYVAGAARKLLGAVLLSFGPADTIEIRLSDGVRGQVSGLKLQGTSLRVSTPEGVEFEGSVIYRAPDTVRFVPLTETTAQGTYTLRVGVEDSLGNKPLQPYPVTFNIGAASTGPTLLGTTPDPAVYLNPTVPARPWNFTARVADNSGTGINPQASGLELYSAAADTLIAGVSSADAQGNLGFEATQFIATDGTLDGEFELRVVAEDNDPTSGTLVAAVRYFYDTRRPDTLKTSADSALVAVTLADRQPGSGVDLGNSSIQVSFQGQPLTAVSYTNDGDSTLFAEFDPPLRTPGNYTVTAVCTDRAGNTRTRTRSFFISAGIMVTGVVPADGAIISRSLAENRKVAAVTLQDRSGTGIDTSATYISLIGPTGRVINGVSAVDAQGQVTFTLAAFLAVDGSDDGRYTMQFNADDKDPSTEPVSTSFTFLYDTQAPDTLALFFYGDGRIDSVSVLVTDNIFKLYREFSGTNIAPEATYLNVLSPAGTPVAGSGPVLQNLQEFYRITRHFDPPLTGPGTYTAQAVMQDLAGNSRERLKQVELWAAAEKPQLQAMTPPAGIVLNAAAAQPLTVSVQVADRSERGLNLQASMLQLLGPDFQPVAGTVARTAGTPATLAFTFGGLLSTDGTDDGTYRVVVHAEDNHPESADLDTTLHFIFDTVLPDTLRVVADSQRVAATLADRPPGSGINLLTSSIAVEFAGAPLGTARYTNDGDSTLFADFDPPLTTVGTYTIRVVAVDKGGNQRLRTKSFTIGSFEVNPPGLVQVSTLFGQAVSAEGLSQPVSIAVQLQDNSGTGIDWGKTTLVLAGPDSATIPGELARVEETTLVLTAGRLLSNSGTDDGTYRAYLHAVDFSAVSADLDTSFSFIYDNKPPDTAAVVFAPDTSSISILLSDLPAVAGRASSGLELLAATATVLGPDGAAVPAELTHDGRSTLTLTFTGGKPAAAGIYTLRVSAGDRAGNLVSRTIGFPLNIGGRIVFFPPDSSVVRGPLARVTAAALDSAGIFTPGQDALLRLTHQGLAVSGTSAVAGDTLVFTLADTLPTDGRADGRYQVSAEMDVPEMGILSKAAASFTVDNLPPDTVSVEVVQSADGVLVRAQFSDGGSYPDVAGIDRQATRITFEDPAGKELVASDTLWLDENRLEARFAPFEALGMHTLRLVVADLAGWSATRTRSVINTTRLAEGGSVAFVEEVPARTSARISYIAGRADSRITRAVLRIFNLRGDLIRRVDVSDRIDPAGSAVTAEWLLDNDRGSLVMNGVFIYYWEITFADGRADKVRKTLAVAR